MDKPSSLFRRRVIDKLLNIELREDKEEEEGDKEMEKK